MSRRRATAVLPHEGGPGAGGEERTPGASDNLEMARWPEAGSPLLSVTLTNYNYGRFLPRAIESILRQSFTDFELIIIDNASTDGSLEVIRSYAADDLRIRVIAHEHNLGMFASLRETCDVARGRYRVHVDADDWVLAPDAFARQVAILDSRDDLAFVYSAMTMMDMTGRELNVSRPYPADTIVPGEVALEAMLGFNITHSGMMLRLDHYRACGGYVKGFVMCLDVVLAVRLCEQGRVAYINDRLYAFGQHDSNDHLALRLNVVRDEILPMIDLAFSGPLAQRLANPAAMRRRVVRSAVVHGPTQDIFSGRMRSGWRMYLASARIRPADTILQRRTLSLCVRTLVGKKGYGWLRSAGSRGRRPLSGAANHAW